MSVSGSIAMGLLRLVKPGKGSYGRSSLETLKRKAEEENAAFEFSLPKGRHTTCELVSGTERPCPVIVPKGAASSERAVLYVYGGLTNTWKAQRSMAVRFAVDTGTPVWYPVYPAMTEVPVARTVSYLVGIYRRMLERCPAEGIAFCGVSMGGLFALQVVDAINQWDLGLPMPGLVIAHSPGGMADDERDWGLFRRYERRDPFFAEVDLRMVERMTPPDPAGETPAWLLHPAQGDFRGAPPTHLYFGEEMLAGNAELYRRAFERSGAGGRLHVAIAENMMHCYSCMPVFPESRQSYHETVELVRGMR